MIICILCIELFETEENAKDWTPGEITLLPFTVIFGTFLTRLVLTFLAKGNLGNVTILDVLKSVFVLWEAQVIQDLLRSKAQIISQSNS